MHLFDGPADKPSARRQQDFCQSKFLGDDLSLLRLAAQALQALHGTRQLAHLWRCPDQMKNGAGAVLALEPRLPKCLTDEWRSPLDA